MLAAAFPIHGYTKHYYAATLRNQGSYQGRPSGLPQIAYPFFAGFSRRAICPRSG
jgi:hypothetical protein